MKESDYLKGLERARKEHNSRNRRRYALSVKNYREKNRLRKRKYDREHPHEKKIQYATRYFTMHHSRRINETLRYLFKQLHQSRNQPGEEDEKYWAEAYPRLRALLALSDRWFLEYLKRNGKKDTRRERV